MKPKQTGGWIFLIWMKNKICANLCSDRNIKKLATITLILVIIGSALLLLFSLWPWILSNIAFYVIITSILWLPPVAIVGIITFMLLVKMVLKTPRNAFPIIFRFVLAGLIVFISVIAFKFLIPYRIIFPICCSSFDGLIDSAPVSEYEGEELNRQIGIWNIDRYGADPRGGVYFRTGTGLDGIGPDQMSYGFVYKPNKNGSPFGNAHYHTVRLIRDWYYFCVSDDW